MKHEVAISGMTCSSCVARVQSALEELPQVSQAVVTLDPPLARLDIDRTVKVGQLRTALRSVGDYDIRDSADDTSWLAIYFPLLLIVAFVIGGTSLLALRSGNTSETAVMSDFMGLFFVTFSFFKLLDIRGFARAFRTYDLIAEQSRVYALAYPFVELTLGVAYLTRWLPLVINFATLVLMLIGSFGVIAALRSKRRIRCACLGSVFNLPMSRVTLIEDLLMALMALALLARLVI